MLDFLVFVETSRNIVRKIICSAVVKFDAARSALFGEGSDAEYRGKEEPWRDFMIAMEKFHDCKVLFRNSSFPCIKYLASFIKPLIFY